MSRHRRSWGLKALEECSKGLRAVRVSVVPSAGIRIKRGVPGVEGNRPGQNWSAAVRIRRCVKDRSAARMFGVIDRAVVERRHGVYVGGSGLSAEIRRDAQSGKKYQKYQGAKYRCTVQKSLLSLAANSHNHFY